MKILSRQDEEAIALTDGATVTVDPAKGHHFTHSGSVGRTFSIGTPGYDAQVILIRMKNTSGGPITHALTVGDDYQFRYLGLANSLREMPAGYVDYLAVQYNPIDLSWDVIGYTGGEYQIPGGGAKKVQYNQIGSLFGGAANVEIENDHLRLVAAGTPPTPSSGGVSVFGRSYAGRILPAIVGPSGIDTALQAGLHGNSVFMVAPANSTTAPTAWGGVLTTAATISHQQTIASSNPWQATRRTRFQTSTTAGTTSGMRTAYAQWFRGNAAGFGGWFFRAQLGQTINLNGGQLFVGMCNSTAALAGEPSALLNMCGMGYDAADASTGNWFFMRNDGSGTAVKTDLGATNAARNTTHGYDLVMFLPPNGSELFVRIVNLHTGATVLDTSYTTEIPIVNTGLAFKAEVRNGTQAAAANVEVAKVYIESDY